MNLLDPDLPCNRRKLRKGLWDRISLAAFVIVFWALLIGSASWCVFDTVRDAIN